MKEKFLIGVLLCLILVSCKPKGNELPLPKGLDQEFFKKASYIMGYDLGNSSIRDTLPIDIDEFVKGYKAGLKGDSSAFTPKELDSLRNLLQDFIMIKQSDRQMAERKSWEENAPRNKQKSDSFMLTNKNKPGVNTTSSGLQYIILKEGKGETPSLDDLVKIHVIGYYMDGSKFDDTYEREPLKMPINAMMPGWREALLMMKPGSKWKIFLPPELGFGVRGMPPLIPSNAALIFDIEYISNEGKGPKVPSGSSIPPTPEELNKKKPEIIK
ncbi:MAG: FKBP-type peptidyl-prolyl cis-trans isomerase N-terminal domain-containing protein [Candidatus Woesearchaeota archaeon]